MKRINAERGLGTGAGDNVLQCWLNDCEFWCTAPLKKDIFNLFGKPVTNQLEGCISMRGAFAYDLRRMKAHPRLESWAKALGVKTTSRPKANISEAAMGAADALLRNRPKPILLFPLSNVRNRIWPAPYWLDLSWKLKEKGQTPLIVTPSPDANYKASPGNLHGLNTQTLAALMMRSKFVIGNDSFPAHLAATLDVKTFVLGGPTGEMVFAHAPSAKIIKTKRMDCVTCCYGSPFRGVCDSGCAALYALFVADVLDEVKCEL